MSTKYRLVTYPTHAGPLIYIQIRFLFFWVLAIPTPFCTYSGAYAGMKRMIENDIMLDK